MLEHVWPWQKIVKQMVGVCKIGGKIVWTTRSHPFPFHGYPDDTWRYDTGSMVRILPKLGCRVDWVGPDPKDPGVFAVGTRMSTEMTLGDKEPVRGVTEAPDGFGLVDVDTLNVWRGGPKHVTPRIDG